MGIIVIIWGFESLSVFYVALVRRKLNSPRYTCISGGVDSDIGIKDTCGIYNGRGVRGFAGGNRAWVARFRAASGRLRRWVCDSRRLVLRNMSYGKVVGATSNSDIAIHVFSEAAETSGHQ